MEKILTISIAAYNVEKYIEKALESLLVEGINDLEVLVEDDGGTDDTAKIVKKYEEKYPDIIKLIHKENGGYGSTVNKSIELARGKYFKQLDGDDWYDSENFKKLLELLRTIDVDALYTPHREYREVSEKYSTEDYFDKDINGKYNVEEVIINRKENLMMHTLLYKTELLRKCNLKLIEKCFYTDTQYAMCPLMFAETIYITHLPLYVYRIGRKDQSISIPSHKKHYEDHIKVSKKIIKFYNENEKSLTPNKRQYLLKYLKHHVGNTIVSFLLILDPSKENLEKIKEFESYIFKENKMLYEELSNQSKLVKILRTTKYNYFVYKVLSKLKTKKIEKSQK